MTPLQKNSQSHLYRFLEYLSSTEEQERYKNAVLFVHIPIELINQWLGVFKLEQQWFRDIWTNEQWLVLCGFDQEINLLWNQLPEEIPDVPEIFENQVWLSAIILAKETMKAIKK